MHTICSFRKLIKLIFSATQSSSTMEGVIWIQEQLWLSPLYKFSIQQTSLSPAKTVKDTVLTQHSFVLSKEAKFWNTL
jgi:hypothetical protein